MYSQARRSSLTNSSSHPSLLLSSRRHNPLRPLEGLKLLPPDRLEEFRTRYTADIAKRAAERWDGRLVKNAYVALYVKGVRPL